MNQGTARAPIEATKASAAMAIERTRDLERKLPRSETMNLLAACLITSVPIAVVYNFFVDRFLSGFTVGAIK